MAHGGKKHSKIVEAFVMAVVLGICVLSNSALRKIAQELAGVAIWVVIFFITFAVLLAIFRPMRSRNGITETDAIPEPTNLRESDARPPDSPQNVLAQQLHSIDWFQFEKLTEAAYAKTHSVIRRGGAKADGGIDLIIENSSGKTAVQCKRWKSWKVGVRNVRELIGAMTVAGLQKGILITIKGYSAEASELAKSNEIELLDESSVLRLLEHADASAIQAILNDRRKFCPRCENEMVLRTSKKGRHVGSQFWGCSDYPKCHQTLPFESTS